MTTAATFARTSTTPRTGDEGATLPTAADDGANRDDQPRAPADSSDASLGDAWQEETTRGDQPIGVGDVGSGDPASSTLPPAHVPDAARSFDPWGLRASTSYDDPGATRRYAEAFLGLRRNG